MSLREVHLNLSEGLMRTCRLDGDGNREIDLSCNCRAFTRLSIISS